MKNLIKWALFLSVLSLAVSLVQYGLNVTEHFPQLLALLYQIWPIIILINGVPLVLISYVLLKQQSEKEPKQDFNKQGYKK